MRFILFLFVMLSFIPVKAQSQFPLNDMNQAPGNTYNRYSAISDSNTAQKKWTLQKYGGISASYGFFSGGNASIFSAPIGIQLNRRLNNNLYAFAGIAAAPAYINFNRSFINSDINKNHQGNTMFNSSGFTMYSKFEAGLMYINDDRTFSVSGSIGVYRNDFPGYPFYDRTTGQHHQPAPAINAKR
jgi:hypothetical protein